MTLPFGIVVIGMPRSSDLIPWTPDVVVRRSVVGSPTGIVILLGVNFQFATAISIEGWADDVAGISDTAAATTAARARPMPRRLNDVRIGDVPPPVTIPNGGLRKRKVW